MLKLIEPGVKTAVISIAALLITWKTVSYVQHSLTFNPKKVSRIYDYKLQKHENKLKKKFGNIKLEEHFIGQNNDINAIYMKNENKDMCIIYCHGNSGTLENYMNFLYDFGSYANIIIFDYSGYGKSKGFPNSESVCNNAFEVWDFVVNILKIKPENVILYGFSLGGAVVTNLAKKLDDINSLPKAVIIQSTFSSQAEMAKQMLPLSLYYFLQLFMDHSLDSQENLKKIGDKTKVLILHSKDDELIKFHHSKSLSNNDIDKIIEIKGSHNNYKLTDEFWNKFNSSLENKFNDSVK